MSAFVVDKAHINAMLQYGLAYHYGGYGLGVTWYTKEPRQCADMQELQEAHRKLTRENANAVGQMLLDENIASVRYRYQDAGIAELPGRTDAEYLLPFALRYMRQAPSAVQVLKLVNCYEYQSCEHAGWDTSEAKVFCEALRHYAIHHLPGYEDAPWEWTPSSEVQRC